MQPIKHKHAGTLQTYIYKDNSHIQVENNLKTRYPVHAEEQLSLHVTRTHDNAPPPTSSSQLNFAPFRKTPNAYWLTVARTYVVDVLFGGIFFQRTLFRVQRKKYNLKNIMEDAVYSTSTSGFLADCLFCLSESQFIFGI